MTDFKKGGPLQNSNIYATNRLFVKNPLFKKKKKKRAPGVYNPKAKFKYEDGGEKGCPPGQQYNPYTKKCEPKLEDRTFLNLMRDRKYGSLQQFKQAPKSSYNPEYIQNLKEFTITASKKAKAKKNKKKTDAFNSDYEKLVEEYDKLRNSPLLANQEKAEGLLRQIKEIELYTPPKNQISFEGDPVEDFINKNILDDAMGKASVSAAATVGEDEDEIDNFRHPQAGRYAAEAIVNYFPEWAQYTGIPQTAGLWGANAMGIGHELGTIFGDPRWFDDTYPDNKAPGFLEKAKMILGESGEDIFNNAVGAGVGVLPMNSRDKTNTLLELSNQNMLPDGIVRRNPSNNLYLKKGPNDPGKFKSPYKQELGGSIIDLTEEEIQKYIDGGYVVEEVNDPSIPALTKAAKGGASKGCKDGEYWDGTKCTKLITLKNDKKYIDGVANWAMHVSDPNKISSDYNDQIKDRLYSGKWGLDPETGALVKLSAVQPKSVTTVDAKTKASREKEKLAEKNYRAEEENKKAYEQSIIDAGFDPATFGKAKGINTITGEPIYASSKEEADRINQEAINQAAIEGHAAVVNNPVFKTAANFTPVGMAVGAIEGLARFIPDAYTLAQNPSWAAAGQLGMDALQAAPVIGKPLATATGKAFDYVKNMEPVAPGPMMLLGRTGSTNMVKKNMNYYKQLLDSYDSKKMSASNRKFYNDLIETGKKQDGMLTEAQLRELDRLKNSNFDFGKRGYNKESLSQVEPKASTQNVIGATPEERLKEIYRRFNLPKIQNKEAQEVFSNFKQRIESPEGKKRLKELGIKSDDLLQKIKIVEDDFSYGYYSPDENMIALNPNDPLIKNTMRHEIEHAVQNAIEKDYGSMSDIFKNLFKKGTLVPNQAKGISEIDDVLSKLELRKTPTPNKQWTGNVIGDEPVDISDFKPGLKKRQLATDYFTSGSGGKEKSAFLGEVQQYMMDKGIIPKDSYVEITPKMVEETFIDALGDEAAGGRYLRLFDIMKPTEKNYKTVAKGLNKMLVAVPTAGAVGTATMLANPFQGSNGLQQQKKGGATDDYIEVDIPEEEIQWYIDNGYRVEPVTKLKKFIG